MPRAGIAAVVAAVSALTALTPAPASAVTAGWMVGGTQLSGSKALANTAAVDESWRLGAASVTIECTGGVTTGTSPQIVSPTGGSASSVTFNGCATTECKVTKTISTAPVKVEITLDGTLAAKATVSPATKSVFASIEFDGSECALQGIQPVTGKASFLAPTGQDEDATHAVDATVTAASGELKVGSSAAELKGSVLARLASGELWSFLSASAGGWMVNGTSLTGTKALATTSTVDESWEINAAGVPIACLGKTVSSASPQISAPAGGGASAVTFTECATDKCEVPKTISTVPVTVTELTLDGASAAKATLIPNTKSVFATVKFEGSECPLLGVQPITGKAGVSVLNGQTESTIQTVEASVSAASNELKLGSSQAELAGSALLRLASGETWSFL